MRLRNLCLGIVGCVSLIPAVSWSQTVIAVPFDTATFSWTAPATDATHGPATSHTITCGANTLSVPMPTTTSLVSAVIPAPGTYTCTVAAVNTFGTSAPVSFPQFEAGFPPLSPTNPQIVIP